MTEERGAAAASAAGHGRSAAVPPGARPGGALAGIALAVAACACFALLDLTTKRVGSAVPLVMMLWARYLFHTLLTTAYVLHREGLRVLRTTQPRFQVLRAVLFAAMSLFGLLSILHMPLAEFTAIVATTPLCVTVVAALWLHQHVSVPRWGLVALGLAGTLAIIRPGGQAFGWALIWPLCLLATGTGYQVVSSRMAGHESPATTQLYTGWLATALVSLAVPFAWASISDPWLWAGMLLMGLLSASGHMLLMQAYARTTPVTLAPFLYSQIGFAMLAGWLVFRHVPDHWAMAGIAAIVLSGAASAWLTVRETR